MSATLSAAPVILNEYNAVSSDGYLGGKASYIAGNYCHGMATFALAEAYALRSDPAGGRWLREPVARAVDFIVSQQTPDGAWRYVFVDNTYGDMSMFGWQFMALKSAEAGGIRVPETTREFAINASKAMGVPKAFLPLHRGSDGFMSIEQFEVFYWPQLKSMLETLVDNGITPVVFYEGCWDKRLGHLAQLPKGKTVGYFQSSDIFKVKEVLGDTMCIIGGMPNSLLAAGPAEAVRARTKEVCERVGKNGGFIMSTAVGEMVGSDPEMVRVWAEATREFGTY